MKIFRKIAILLAGHFVYSAAAPSLQVDPAGFEGAFSGVCEAFAETLESAAAVMKRSFPLADKFDEIVKRLDEGQKRLVQERAVVTLDPIYDKRFFIHTARAGGRVLGYGIEDTVHGKWGPIHYLLVLDPEGRVLEAAVLEYRERRGAPVAKKRFWGQFVGKRAGDPLRLQKEIQGITGATISSRGMTEGIRKLLEVFKVFYAS